MSPHENLPPARPRRRPVPQPVPAPPPVPEKPDYEVGYGKPPVHTRFQKGQSGNPKGRKKGSKNLNTLVLELLDERIAVNTPEGRRYVSRVEVLLRKLMELAGKGNARAIDQMLRHYANAQASPSTGSGVTEAEAAQDVTDADLASLALLRDILLGDVAAGEAGAS
ncbi:DUF5681 domain-containing protein [Sphingomonas sp. CD22]|uniref:DUF5681 domain-containing protein n=1 Tax=Sphingomonas sp. CD22 TaxID=3100214 RepID=UPI002AE065FA|nr:DUF5681 domain-containing protein [Sphingomonas sp. CD22]MEA1085213.1 DUF5681 domain-containing protein [Sphingomonas sp. CD22]